MRGEHLAAIVVRLIDYVPNRVVLTIFPCQTGTLTANAVSSTVSHSVGMVPGTWHYIEDCLQQDADDG